MDLGEEACAGKATARGNIFEQEYRRSDRPRSSGRCSFTLPPSTPMPKKKPSQPHPLFKRFKLSEIKQLPKGSGLP